jgi:hypothetical protein
LFGRNHQARGDALGVVAGRQGVTDQPQRLGEDLADRARRVQRTDTRSACSERLPNMRADVRELS